MKCPKCSKSVSNLAKHCPQCGTRFIRQSDKLASKMALSGRLTTLCGGGLIFLGVLAFLYGSGLGGTILLGIGVLLALTGLIKR
ncbi:hypothetical protein [Pseudodesulfovibrio sediminis]|uniref:Zinc ribbon domain-containing protein n=1 Tax=Pseudodesulfovibrio sediminis TaxID=2810563 RepID=A0ABN6ETB6_9BACT|nr:hypothetical protein [Pseudodesulfovibrio sediminis]BCS88409.1 hypothetical protein PSDVSF_16510 [Pseudodesulfovibrio sediminis]